MFLNLIIPIWKPISWTSFDIVKKVRSIIKMKKVGHAGTLDPFAEGILVVCTGNKTAFVEKIMDYNKEYEGVISLGCRTSTLDPEGPITEYKKIKPLSIEKINLIKDKFIGKINQIPPQFSAIKHKGVPMYKYARKNIRIDIDPREVEIYNFQIDRLYKKEIKFKIECSRGTYIRSIARDFALELGTLGYLTELKRTKVGQYSGKNAIKIENLEEWLFTKI